MEFYYHDTDKDVLILNADGGLLSDNSEHFTGELEKYVESGARKLIVDCEKLSHISSYGLGILIAFHRRLSKKGGDVKFAHVNGVVGKVFNLTGLGAVFSIYPSVADARKAFDAQQDSPAEAPQ